MATAMKGFRRGPRPGYSSASVRSHTECSNSRSPKAGRQQRSSRSPSGPTSILATCVSLATSVGIPVSVEDPNSDGLTSTRDVDRKRLVLGQLPQDPVRRGTANGADRVEHSRLATPRVRGRAPLTWAIIQGRSETGVTVHVLEPTVDTGPIVLERTVQIAAADTVATVQRRMLEALSEHGAGVDTAGCPRPACDTAPSRRGQLRTTSDP